MTPRPVRLLRNLNRGREIVAVLVRHGFGDVVRRLRLRRYLNFGRRVFFWRKDPEPGPEHSTPERLRMALEDLGATFIKFGQVASTRPDVLPADMIAELSKLRETVPPFPPEVSVAAVEAALGRPVGELFREFDPVPVAAGSLGQVHRAVGKDGAELAVKVRRPGVKAEIERDLSLMFDLAALVERRLPELKVFDPAGLVRHFSRTIRREVDFTREANAAAEIARLFGQDSPDLCVPAVRDELTTEAVLTTEWLAGLPVDDPATLRRRGLDPAEIAAKGARVFLKQVFAFGLFHGDPHPGNVRVIPPTPRHPAGRIGLLDFGMVGVLDESVRDRLVDLLAAVARGDVPGVSRHLLALGTPLGEIDESALRTDLREFLATHYNVPLARLRVAAVLGDFLSLLSRHRIRLPGDLMLLVRAAVSVEGTGRRLDPDFNLAAHLAPFAKQLLKERLDPKRLAKRFAGEAGELASLAAAVPHQLGRTLEKLSRDELRVQLDVGGLDTLTQEIDRAGNRLAISLAMSSLILASALLIRSVPESFWFAVPIFLLSSLLGLWLVYGVFRSGSL
ncbi:ABC1 kinase family protein [Alienimonas sp. DA493]|uniref:ABC1 kinase family protein n=1 Tax=Alienimonas sp. DA493 TaxID=3373605 RepID=UPI00375471CD